MTLGDIILFAVIGVLAGNYVVTRLPRWEERMWLFWLQQGLNFGVLLFLVIEGIPDIPGPFGIFNYVFALLFMMRVIQNNTRLTRARQESREVKRDVVDEKRAALAAALARGEARVAGEE